MLRIAPAVDDGCGAAVASESSLQQDGEFALVVRHVAAGLN